MLMISLGQNPSGDELRNIIEEVDQDGSGVINLEELLGIMAKMLCISTLPSTLE
jgi:Ca2+-binding EF-hand superfamily protein